MRRLAFAVHPDRFATNPAAAAENAASLAVLQGLLTTVCKSRDSHPPAQLVRLFSRTVVRRLLIQICRSVFGSTCTTAMRRA